MSTSEVSLALLAATTRALKRAAQRPQVRAVASTAGLNILVMVLGSIGGLFLARALGPTLRGDLVTVLMWPAMIGSVASVGITQATCYWTARTPEKGPAVMSTAVAGSLGAGIVVAVLAPSVAPLIGRNSMVTSYLTLVLALTPLYIAGGVWISALQATNISSWNIARAILPLLYLAIVVFLWAAGRLTLGSAVVAFAIALVGQGCVAMALARRKVGHHRRPELALLRPLYGYGLKVSVASVPQIINVNVDQLILSVMPAVSPAQLGNYAVAVSMSWLALPASVAFGSVAFPRIATSLGTGQTQRIERISMLGAGLSAGVTIALISILAPLLVPRLFGKGFVDSVYALWLLAPGTVFLALNRVLGDLLQGLGRPLVRSAGEGIGAVVTLVLLIVLIPRLGIRGAAVASSVAYAVVFAYLLWGLRRETRRSAARR